MAKITLDIQSVGKKPLISIPPGTRIKLELPTGETVIEYVDTKQDILKQKYANLMGNPITISEAAAKYGVPRPTIQRWKDNGYITILELSYPAKFDEAEIKYCVDIYLEKKQLGLGFYGSPLLDEDGLPYQLKHPQLSEYRRRKKTKAN